MKTWSCIGALSTALIGLAPVSAQPAVFHDAGSFSAPSSPPSTRVYVSDSSEYLSYGSPPQVLTVQWIRFELTAPIQGDLFVDIAALNYAAGTDLLWCLYDNAGNLVTYDAGAGGSTSNGGSTLSFGSTGERVPYFTEWTAGQDGPLAAGTYWLALVAGDLPEITIGETNWNVTTTASYELGFDEGQVYLEAYIMVGNTTFPAAPSNNDCANATLIGEDVGSTPAWVGSTVGATQDGFSSCYPDLVNLTTKDVWLRYVPSADGWVTMTLSGGAGGGATPLLTRYAGDCGSGQVRCAGGGSFSSAVGTRLTFQVVQGEPVLLAAAVRAGQWGPLTLNVDLIGDPCDLATPGNARPESEACGGSGNDGCLVSPAGYEPISVGQTFAGTLFNTLTTRDVDYYRFTLARQTTVVATARTQLPFTLQLLRTNATTGCPARSVASVQSLSYLELCQPRSVSATLDPGTYVVAISHSAFDGFECGSGYEGYWLSLIDPNAPSCPADFNGDGFLDFFDFDDFVACFEGVACPPGADADFNGDGFTDFFDYDEFVAAFEVGC